MAKKQAVEEDFNVDEMDEDGGNLGDLNFDVNDEYKAEPLVPKGVYHGVATAVKFEATKFAIMWDFCLHDNGGFMNDGETPIDGAHVYFRNWLPKPGDEHELTKSGRNNKRQSKINMLMDFQNGLGINMSTPNIIAESLADQVWVGVEADLEVDVDEYQGRFRNTVNKVTKSKMY